MPWSSSTRMRRRFAGTGGFVAYSAMSRACGTARTASPAAHVTPPATASHRGGAKGRRPVHGEEAGAAGQGRRRGDAGPRGELQDVVRGAIGAAGTGPGTAG